MQYKIFLFLFKNTLKVYYVAKDENRVAIDWKTMQSASKSQPAP